MSVPSPGPAEPAASALRSAVSVQTATGWIPRDRRDRWILALILLGALLLRLAVLWMPGDQMFENGLPAFEELQRGNATYDLLRGPLLPLFDYQLNHFSGGSLVVSILAVPMFWLFGPTFQALRLVSLLFSIPLVFVAFVTVYRWSGRRAAIVAGCLLAFAPPGFTFLSCTVYGTHPEGNSIAMLLVCLFLAWHTAGRGGMLRTFFLGMLIGFALYFTYGLCVIVAVLLLLDFAATGVRRVRKTDIPLGLGFLIGFTPWVLYMTSHPGQAFHIYGSSITEHVSMGVNHGGGIHKLVDVAMRDGPNAFWMHIVWPWYGGVVASCLFFTLTLVVVYSTWTARYEILAFVRALFGDRRGFSISLRLVSLLFVYGWLTAFTLTDFQVDTYTWVQGYRYLMPFYPFVIVLFGIAVQDFFERERRGFPTILVALICISNVGLTVAQLRPDEMRAHWSEAGTNEKWHLRKLVGRHGDDPDMMLYVLRRAIASRTEDEQAALADGLARGITLMATRPVTDQWPEPTRRKFADSLSALANEAPPKFRPVFEKYLAQSQAPPESH